MSRYPTSTCRCCSRRWSSTAATHRSSGPAGNRADDFPVVVIGCGESGSAGGDPAQGGRYPVHHRREERRRRRDRGTRTPIPARASTSATTSTATASSRPTNGRTSSPNSPSCRRTSRTVMDKYDIGGHVLWETEVTEASWDDDTATWTVRGTRPQRSDDDLIGARGDQRRGAAEPAAPSRRSKDSRTSPGRRSTPASGTTPSTSTASGSP